MNNAFDFPQDPAGIPKPFPHLPVHSQPVQRPLRPSDWNYEATVAEVETIIGQIEAGKLELAEVFEQFAQAMQQLHQCETFLMERQQQMNLLIETLEDEGEDA